MKRILAAGVAAALLIGTLAPMAAAGIFQGDMLRSSSGEKCGTVQIVGSLVILTLNLTGTNCSPSTATDLALCYPILGGGGSVKIVSIADTNGNGKINGAEGVLRGAVAGFSFVSGLEVWSGVQVADALCNTNGTLQYVSGWHK